MSTATRSKLFIPALGSLYESIAPLGEPLVRLTAGLFLVPHGAQKLFGLFGGHGLAAAQQAFATHLGLPGEMAIFAGLIEFFGGLALALGLFTRVAAALVVGMMVVAVFHVHLPNGFFWTEKGFEYPAMWGLLALASVLRGGGRYSLDALIGREL